MLGPAAPHQVSGDTVNESLLSLSLRSSSSLLPSDSALGWFREKLIVEQVRVEPDLALPISEAEASSLSISL